MLENIDNKATRGSISQIILKALNSGDKYGYEICKDIERLSNGRLILKQPSLYSCLRRMEEQKLISSYWKDSLLGGRRHYYSVTEKGKKQFEENKSIWKDDEELLKSLPDNESVNKEVDKTIVTEDKENINNSDRGSSTLQKKENTIYILDQENLFNIARKKDEEIKKITLDKNEGDEKHTSFLQFDFFEQNIKVLKKNNEKSKEDIQVYSNKFSNMDNHSQDIEPESGSNKNKFNKEGISLSSILDKEIKRESSSTELKENASSPLSQHINKEKKSNSNNIFSYLKNTNTDTPINEKIDEQTNLVYMDHNMNNNIYSKELHSMANEEENNINNINKNSNDFDNISWEKTENGDAPLFDHDYKFAIGKLYNNSQLKDPYEQNKFQTFKEIFPSSTLEEKEQTEVRQTKIDAVIQSSSNSNIDCDDIKMLNNLYNLQGLNIKQHNSNENKNQNKIYKDKNKINMISAWIIVIIGLLEFFSCYLILNKNNLFLNNQSVVYIICSVLLLLIGIIFTIRNMLDRYKLIIFNKKFSRSFIISLLIFILLIVGTFAINLALGMNSLGQVKFLSFWLIPCILFSNILLSQVVYAILLKSRFFNS